MGRKKPLPSGQRGTRERLLLCLCRISFIKKKKKVHRFKGHFRPKTLFIGHWGKDAQPSNGGANGII